MITVTRLPSARKNCSDKGTGVKHLLEELLDAAMRAEVTERGLRACHRS